MPVKPIMIDHETCGEMRIKLNSSTMEILTNSFQKCSVSPRRNNKSPLSSLFEKKRLIRSKICKRPVRNLVKATEAKKQHFGVAYERIVCTEALSMLLFDLDVPHDAQWKEAAWRLLQDLTSASEKENESLRRDITSLRNVLVTNREKMDIQQQLRTSE